MEGTWWVGQSELDDDQRNIISLPIDLNIFVTGPPGSGKTNLLLLRANYLYLAGKRNIAVISFTRPLCDFILSGAAQYDFPAAKIVTCREWQYDFLRQYGSRVRLSGEFEDDRGELLRAITSVMDNMKISKIYDAILLDEAQDYTPGEIRIFERLADRLFCVADERQKIYEGEDSIDVIKSLIGLPHTLHFHYRTGRNICRVADEIAKKWHEYRPLVETAKYDEASSPSTVDQTECGSVEEQASLIISRISTQRIAFPNQLIGILCPTKASMYIVWDAINSSEHSDAAFLLHSSVSDRFPTDKLIIVSTFHAAKGLEFRALHLAGCDELKTSFFNNNRRITFTAVTRAKTALSIYHCANLHGYFDAALRVIEPSPSPPSLDDLFGRSR